MPNINCPYCNCKLEYDDSLFLVCRQHENMLITVQLEEDYLDRHYSNNIVEIYLAKDGYEFNLSYEEKKTALYKYNKNGRSHDSFFDLNEYCYLFDNVQYTVLETDTLLDITPDNFVRSPKTNE